MGFGTEILIVLLLGFLILGPKQMHAMLGHVARAKAVLDNAARGIKSQLATELDAAPRDGKRGRAYLEDLLK
jgi:Sec-independent protein translocase protein TatA